MSSSTIQFDGDLWARFQDANAKLDRLNANHASEAAARHSRLPQSAPNDLAVRTLVHDLNNALNRITGYLNLVVGDIAATGDDARTLLGAAVEAALTGALRVEGYVSQMFSGVEHSEQRLTALRQSAARELKCARGHVESVADTFETDFGSRPRANEVRETLREVLKALGDFERGDARFANIRRGLVGRLDSTDVKSVIESKAASMRARAGDQVELVLSLARGSQFALANAEALGSVLENLIGNAIDACKTKALPDPDDRHVVEISLLNMNGRTRVLVADSGSGMEADLIAQVTSGMTTKPHGHGVGVPGCIAMLRAMGSELDIRSKGPGRGAIFSFDLALVNRPAPPL